jgi:hypothetical protein
MREVQAGERWFVHVLSIDWTSFGFPLCQNASRKGLNTLFLHCAHAGGDIRIIIQIGSFRNCANPFSAAVCLSVPAHPFLQR